MAARVERCPPSPSSAADANDAGAPSLGLRGESPSSSAQQAININVDSATIDYEHYYPRRAQRRGVRSLKKKSKGQSKSEKTTGGGHARTGVDPSAAAAGGATHPGGLDLMPRTHVEDELPLDQQPEVVGWGGGAESNLPIEDQMDEKDLEKAAKQREKESKKAFDEWEDYFKDDKECWGWREEEFPKDEDKKYNKCWDGSWNYELYADRKPKWCKKWKEDWDVEDDEYSMYKVCRDWNYHFGPNAFIVEPTTTIAKTTTTTTTSTTEATTEKASTTSTPESTTEKATTGTTETTTEKATTSAITSSTEAKKAEDDAADKEPKKNDERGSRSLALLFELRLDWIEEISEILRHTKAKA